LHGIAHSIDSATEILNTLEIQYVQCKVSIHSSDNTLDIALLLQITMLLFRVRLLHFAHVANSTVGDIHEPLSLNSSVHPTGQWT